MLVIFDIRKFYNHRSICFIMGKQQLINSLIHQGFSGQIINAFSEVKRENFIPNSLQHQSYDDIPLPIGKGQTISQPYTIATMFSLLDLKKSQNVLEIGSGCGYVLALLSNIVGKNRRVFGIEVIKELVDKARINLKDYSDIKLYNRNGAEGLSEHAPFDRIIISAALPKIPENLILQLKDNGIIVAPIGSRESQKLVKFQKVNEKLIIKKEIDGFIFVPFIINN